MLGRLLSEGLMFSFDFGFIPFMLGGDDDPLDILVPGGLSSESSRRAEDGKTESNGRLLGVANGWVRALRNYMRAANKTYTLSQCDSAVSGALGAKTGDSGPTPGRECRP